MVKDESQDDERGDEIMLVMLMRRGALARSHGEIQVEGTIRHAVHGRPLSRYCLDHTKAAPKEDASQPFAAVQLTYSHFKSALLAARLVLHYHQHHKVSRRGASFTISHVSSAAPISHTQQPTPSFNSAVRARNEPRVLGGPDGSYVNSG